MSHVSPAALRLARTPVSRLPALVRKSSSTPTSSSSTSHEHVGTLGVATRSVHLANNSDPTTGAVIQPITLSATFRQDRPGVALGTSPSSKSAAGGGRQVTAQALGQEDAGWLTDWSFHPAFRPRPPFRLDVAFHSARPLQLRASSCVPKVAAGLTVVPLPRGERRRARAALESLARARS
jgi:hypothetical protein